MNFLFKQKSEPTQTDQTNQTNPTQQLTGYFSQGSSNGFARFW
jgi:hypothetical protein